jgi:hypothetical protein
MTRHASGVFRRNDRVAIQPGTTVSVRSGSRGPRSRAYLLELGSADMVLSGISAPPIGAELSVAITLPGRYIEFEVAGVVAWRRGGDFGVELDYLTARQAYGIVLARELSQSKRADSTVNDTRLAPKIASSNPSTPRR